MNNYKEIYNEDIDRLAEGLREYLQEFNDIGYDVKYEALKIVMNNFKEALRNWLIVIYAVNWLMNLV